MLWLWIALALAGAGGIARAQDPDPPVPPGDEPPTPSTPGTTTAPPDTSLGPPVFGFLVPTYATRYSIVREETAWGQDFKFSNSWGAFSLKNTTQYTIKTNPKRAEFRARDGSISNDLSYLVGGRVPLTGLFNYSRSFLSDSGRRTNTDALDTNVGATYNFRAMRVRNLVRAAIGVARRTDSQDQLGSTLTTDDLGLTRDLGLSSNYLGPIPGMTIKVDGNLRLDGSNPKATEGRGSIRGSVSALDNGGGVPAATVEVLRAGTLAVLDTVQTNLLTPDGKGRSFTVNDLEPGIYDVRMSSPGLVTRVRQASVDIERTTDIGDSYLSTGNPSAYPSVELAGDFFSLNSEYDPSIRVPLQNVYPGVWEVELKGVVLGDHRFKFITGDSRGDFGTSALTCVPERTVGNILPVPGDDGPICATLRGIGSFRITLNEEALLWRVERLAGAEDGPKNKTTSNGQLTWSYEPTEGIKAGATIRGVHNTDSYIVVSNDVNKKGRREDAVDNSTNLSLNLDWQPPLRKTTQFTLNYSKNSSRTERRVEVERASERGSYRFDSRLRHLLWATSVNLHYEQSLDDDRPLTRVASKTLTRVLDGAFDRPISSRLSGRAAGEIRLRRQQYADSLQDLDDLRSRFELGVTYRPVPTLTATFIGSRTIGDARNIDASFAANTSYEERFTLSGNLDWRLTGRTTLTQRYNYQPTFTTFRFNASRDNLQRNRDLNTSINTILNPRLTLKLSHSYRLQESGGFSRAADGTRLFARGDDNYTQELTTGLDFRPNSWLNFNTDERLYRQDRIRVATNRRTVVSRLEFNQRASIQRPLPGGGLVKADLTYFMQAPLRPVAGRVEKYFSANVELNKTF